MSNSFQVFSLFGSAACAVALVGCGKGSGTPPVVVQEEVVEEVDVPALSTTDASDPLAALSDADRAAVLAQKICPVSDEELGGMGTPIKVTVNGRDVFICCESCRDPLVADPDKYLAKLDGN